jgi:hypothetical protein
MTERTDPQRVESLGPAERILQALLTHTDHCVHNRPGVVVEDASTATGSRWFPVTWRAEGSDRVVYRLEKAGKASQRVRIGTLSPDETVWLGARKVGVYRKPGLYPETVAWMYRQIAEVWRLDNEFAARWASWAFPREHRDLKCLLAAFMLVQSRSGQPIREDGEHLFDDDDLRDVGEAMCLLRRKDRKDLNPKLLARVGDLLELPEVAAINRELGFGASGRRPPMGRWPKAVQKWLRHRESNPKMLEGLVKAGFRRTVMRLAQRVGYKPETAAFFQLLRWKQKQAADGRRAIAIGDEVVAAESWDELDERAICERIVAGRPGWKRIVGMLPAEVGVTRAVIAAAMEAGSLSDADLVILTPTLEELGLLQVESIRERWQAALDAAESQRAANVARRVRGADVAQAMQDASEQVARKAVAEVIRGLRLYVVVDKSGSMEGAIERAKVCLGKLLVAFPLDALHVSIFNTAGRELTIRHASKAGVEQAFRGHSAGGGTDYGAGVRAISHHAPEADEDALFLFVGDQLAQPFPQAIRACGIEPVAFALLYVKSSWGGEGKAVEETATRLGLPCFRIDEAIFDDPYAVTRTLQRLVASTPVVAAASKRRPLVEEILATDLLVKPVWAS